MAAVLQLFNGRVTLSGQTFTVTDQDIADGPPGTSSYGVTIPAGSYYTFGYSTEPTLQLVEKVEEQIQAINGGSGYENSTVTYSATTGKVTIAFIDGSSDPVDTDIAWGTATALRDALGFTGDVSGAAQYEAPNEARYVWRPDKALSEHSVERDNAWQPGSTSMVGRSRDGMSWSVPGNTYNEAKLSYRLLNQSTVVKPATGTVYQDFETWFEDVVHLTSPVRYYPDRTQNTASDYVTCLIAHRGETVEEFDRYANRHIRSFQGLWDVDLLLYDHDDSTVAGVSPPSGSGSDKLVFSDDTQFSHSADTTYTTVKTFRLVRDSGNSFISVRFVCTAWVENGTGSSTCDVKLQVGSGTFDELALSTTSTTETVLAGSLTLTVGNSPTDTPLNVNMQIRPSSTAASEIAHLKYTDLYLVYA